MGHEIVYCSQCGVRILEKDISTGRAVTLLDKVFCSACRDKALVQALQAGAATPKAGGASPAPHRSPPEAIPTATRVESPGHAHGTGQATGPPHRPAHKSAPVPHAHHTVVRRPTMVPIYIGSSIGVIGLVILVALIFTNSGSGTTPAAGGSPEKGGSPAPGPTAKGGAATEDRAATRFADLVKFAGTATDPAAVVRRAAEAEKEIAGTPTEEEYRKFRRRWERKVEEVEVGKKIDAQLSQAKYLVASYPNFQRYGEALETLQKAEELAVEIGSERLADVKNARRELEEPYEAKADEWYEKNGPNIRTWIKEDTFKGAISLIDRFPEELKLSKMWRVTLAKMREDCVKGQAALEAKAGGKDPEKDWSFFLRIGGEELNRRSYGKAKENLLKAESMLPALNTLNDQQKQSVSWGVYFNLGCIHAVESKKLEGEAKKKAVDTAFDYLKKACEAGVFGYRCGEREHGSAREHWDQDKDLDPLRSDPRLTQLITKYAK